MGAPSPALGKFQEVLSDSGIKLREKLLNWKPPRNYDELFPYEISGRTKDGWPVLIIPFGKWDLRSAIENGEKEAVWKYVDQIFAKLEQKINEAKSAGVVKMVDEPQSICIVDVSGFSVKQLTSLTYSQFLIDYTKHWKKNYVDLIDTTFIYRNAPRAFSIPFSMVKPFMPKNILFRIEMYTPANHQKFKESLLKKISPDQLPVEFGGVQTRTNICKYLEVDSSGAGADKTLQHHVTRDGVDMVTMNIAAGQEYKLDLEITKPNTTLEWNFKSEHRAIGFSIFYNSSVEILGQKMYESHVASQVGSTNCEKIGTYTLIFDNKTNELNVETLHFIIGVFEP